MAQHKRDQPKQAGAASNHRILLIEHTRAQKRARHSVHGSGRPSIDRKNRKQEGQNCVGGRPRQAQQRPYKMELQNMQAWHSGTKILSLAGPTKTMRLTNEASNFHLRQVKTTNLAICSTKILSLAGPAKTMSLIKWSSKISSAAGPVKTTNLHSFIYWDVGEPTCLSCLTTGMYAGLPFINIPAVLIHFREKHFFPMCGSMEKDIRSHPPNLWLS